MIFCLIDFFIYSSSWFNISRDSSTLIKSFCFSSIWVSLLPCCFLWFSNLINDAETISNLSMNFSTFYFRNTSSTGPLFSFRNSLSSSLNLWGFSPTSLWIPIQILSKIYPSDRSAVFKARLELISLIWEALLAIYALNLSSICSSVSKFKLHCNIYASV